MATNAKYGQYKQVAITTANRGEVLIMLYEAAIRHVKKASLAVEKGDVKAKGEAISKAHDIINELMNTLNFEVGGQIALDLERLYNYMTGQLVKANIEGSKEILDSVVKVLDTLLSGWRGAVEQVNKEASAQKAR